VVTVAQRLDSWIESGAYHLDGAWYSTLEIARRIKASKSPTLVALLWDRERDGFLAVHEISSKQGKVMYLWCIIPPQMSLPGMEDENA